MAGTVVATNVNSVAVTGTPALFYKGGVLFGQMFVVAFGCMGLMACEDICPKGIPLQRQLAALRRALAWAALSGKIR